MSRRGDTRHGQKKSFELGIHGEVVLSVRSEVLPTRIRISSVALSAGSDIANAHYAESVSEVQAL